MKLSSAQMDRDAVAVVSRLQNEGYVAYLVGGCVRDALLGIEAKDFDIATSAEPEELRQVFGRRCRLIGKRFQLAHVRSGSKVFEVATFRGRPEDQDSDGESGFVVRANTWGTPIEDARSRDFTINGLFFDPVSGELHDHVGGLPDIEGRRLRTIGDADQRFREDPVRILRAVKFSGRLGLALDPPIAEAARALAPLVHDCPVARVTEELFRLFESGRARPTMQVLRDLGIVETTLPELHACVDGGERWDAYLDWVGAFDRVVAAHGILPRESTFTLLAWPLVEAVVRGDADGDWGAAAADLLQDASIRMSIPIRHRQHLRGTANVLRRIATPGRRRRRVNLFRSPALPTALTIVRMAYTLGRPSPLADLADAPTLREIYEEWAEIASRHGITTAPFESRPEESDADDGGGAEPVGSPVPAEPASPEERKGRGRRRGRRRGGRRDRGPGGDAPSNA